MNETDIVDVVILYLDEYEHIVRKFDREIERETKLRKAYPEDKDGM